jgi:hypothetical protein
MRFPNCPSGRATKTVACRGPEAESFIGCFVTGLKVIKRVFFGKTKRPHQATVLLNFGKEMESYHLDGWFASIFYHGKIVSSK